MLDSVRNNLWIFACVKLASYPGRGGRGKSGLVPFACACASNAVVFSVKLSGTRVDSHVDRVRSKYTLQVSGITSAARAPHMRFHSLES